MKVRWLACLILALLPGLVLAQTYPNRSLKLIVPYPPGGGNDNLARLFGQKLADRLAQPVVIENRPGAATVIGTELAAKAPGDGYTLFLSSVVTHALISHLYPKLAVDPIRDFVAITTLAVAPTVVVANRNLPANTLAELIALLKANPGKYAYASGGAGSTPHIAGEVFKLTSGIDILHVPYKGGGPALTDLIGGQVHVMFDTAASAMPHVRGGRLKALALAAPTRLADFPDLPTVAEAGLPGYSVDSWYSLHAPAGTPREVVARVHAEIVTIQKMPDVVERLRQLGATAGGMAPEEFDRFVRAEHARYATIIKNAGIRGE
ncbi:MAG: Bug family tripartite tricarboxylate transporter substrate binding protein [Burkholderiales bacterium]